MVARACGDVPVIGPGLGSGAIVGVEGAGAHVAAHVVGLALVDGSNVDPGIGDRPSRGKGDTGQAAILVIGEEPFGSIGKSHAVYHLLGDGAFPSTATMKSGTQVVRRIVQAD